MLQLPSWTTHYNEVHPHKALDNGSPCCRGNIGAGGVDSPYHSGINRAPIALCGHHHREPSDPPEVAFEASTMMVATVAGLAPAN